MENNEVELIVNAVDKATATIEKISKSLEKMGKDTGAAGASTEITKVNQALENTKAASETFDLSSTKVTAAMRLIGKIAPGTSGAVQGVSSALRLMSGTAVTAGTITAAAFAVAAAAIVADGVVIKRSADAWSSDVLATWVEHTAKQQAIAEEYKHNIDTISGAYKSLVGGVKDTFGEISTIMVNELFFIAGLPSVPVKLKPQITQKEFDDLVKAGVDAAAEAAKQAAANTEKYQSEMWKGIFSSSITFQGLIDKAGELKTKYEELRTSSPKDGDLKSYNEAVATAKQNWLDAEASIQRQTDMIVSGKLIDYFSSKESPGGITWTETEKASMQSFLKETGLAGDEAITMATNASIKVSEIINSTIANDSLAIANVALVAKSKVYEIKTAVDDIPANKKVSVNIVASATGDTYVLDWIIGQSGHTGGSGSQGGNYGGFASGGDIRGWGMVGDAPGGKITPYTEFVYAPYGAHVYNQAQMAGKSAPPMAGGGIIEPAPMIDYEKLAIIVRDAVLMVAK